MNYFNTFGAILVFSIFVIILLYGKQVGCPTIHAFQEKKYQIIFNFSVQKVVITYNVGHHEKVQ